MSWRDRLQPASFRGVEFKVEAHSSGSGRRLSIHQFPGQDRKIVQDLGRDLDVVRIRAYVIGENYDRDRDRLLAAVRDRGAGLLVHPFLGRLAARCASFRVEERSRDGGMAVLSLEFIEPGASTDAFFRDAADPVAGARQAADSLEVVAVSGYAATVELAGRAGSTADAIAGQINALAAFISGAALRGPFAAVARFRRDVEQLADASLNLAASPLDLANRVRDVIFGLASSFESRQERLRVLLELLAQGPNLSSPTSSLGRRRARNAQATADLIAALAAAAALRAAAEVEWSFLQEAETARTRLQVSIDRVLETADDQTYAGLVAALAAASRVMPPPTENLPSLESVQMRITTPSLVVAYERFADTARDREIADRNPGTVRHPGRVPGGELIEVLSS